MQTRSMVMLSLCCAMSLVACDQGGDGGDGGDDGEGTTTQDDASTTDEPGDPDDPDEPGDPDDPDDDADTTGEPDDEGTAGDEDEAQTFQITIANAGRYHATTVFNTPKGAQQPGPLVEVGAYYRIEFQAVPGSRLSFASMSAATNDWFFAPDGDGIALFDDAGAPITGDVTNAVMLWDAGTEEEDPTTIATVPDGAQNGAPDDDDTIRLVQPDVSGSLSATLEYADGVFTLILARVGDDILTPGLAVVHAGPYPLFQPGQPDRGQGLELLAEAGNPMELNSWLSEVGSDGAPLRLSAALSPLSPGVAYAFPGDASDPLFTQGEPAIAGSGLEDLAEDGANQPAFDYLSDLGYSASLSEGEGVAGPGGALTFTLDAVPGDRLGFATMFVQSNDWFVAFNNSGVPLFDDAGEPITGTAATVEAYLFDAGTEIDQPVGQGADQAPRQGGANIGAPDDDPLVRRVGALDDVQFGKGLIVSAPGAVGIEDPRGGYNLVTVTVELAE